MTTKIDLTEQDLDELEECIPWDKPEKKVCYFCGHRGRDVNRLTYVHVGGQGDVPCPVCDDKAECLLRVESQSSDTITS